MHEASWDLYAPGSPAYELWALLCRCGGQHRWVMANKLLARKRPHLLPVYDNEVAALLQRPKGVWACLWTWFHDQRKRHDHLTGCAAKWAGSMTSACSAASTSCCGCGQRAGDADPSTRVGLGSRRSRCAHDGDGAYACAPASPNGLERAAGSAKNSVGCPVLHGVAPSMLRRPD